MKNKPYNLYEIPLIRDLKDMIIKKKNENQMILHLLIRKVGIKF